MTNLFISSYTSKTVRYTHKDYFFKACQIPKACKKNKDLKSKTQSNSSPLRVYGPRVYSLGLIGFAK